MKQAEPNRQPKIFQTMSGKPSKKGSLDFLWLSSANEQNIRATIQPIVKRAIRTNGKMYLIGSRNRSSKPDFKSRR